jgi:hypothetical protein
LVELEGAGCLLFFKTSDFGITAPETFATLTLVPSSKNFIPIFVGFLIFKNFPSPTEFQGKPKERWNNEFLPLW